MTTPTAPAHDPYAALRHRGFRRFLVASMLATIGTEMQAVAVGWELYERTRNPLDLGLVGLVQVLPVLLFVLPAGQLADRVPRVPILVATHAVLILASLGLAAVSAARGPVALVYACLALVGTATAFALPSRWSLVPLLVPLGDLASAVTWRSSGWQLAAVAGPALGGVALAVFGRAAPVYLLDALAGGLVVALLATLRPRPQPKATDPVSWRSLLAGVRFVGRSDLMLAALTLDLFAVLLGGAVALLPVFARDLLHVGPNGLGALRAAPSVGALVMALVLAHRPPFRHAGRALLVAVAGFGVATIVFGFSRNVGLSLFALFLTGAFDNISVVVRSTLVQLLTPDAMRGRVSAVNAVFVGMSNELGSFESGVAARLLGPVVAVVAGGVGCLAVVGSVALRWPALARLGSLSDLKPLDPDPPPAGETT
jgi:MFS family permease